MSGDYFPAACYNCGQPGHYAADCPERSGKHEHHQSARVVPPPLPPRRPANQVADAAEWAARIRLEMGWPARRAQPLPAAPHRTTSTEPDSDDPEF